MSGSLGDLCIQISADHARFQSDMGRITKSAQESANKISGTLGKLDGSIRAVGSAFATLGVGLSAGALTAWVKGAIDAADEIGKMAQKVGMSTEALSAFQYAGGLADVSTEQLGKGLKILSKNMLEVASGSKEQAALFRALGIEVQNTDGSFRKTDQVFIEIADRFAGLEDGAGKTALAMKVFGKSGADMIPLLNGGAGGIADMTAEARRLGLILNEETTKAAEEFNDNLTRLKSASTGLGFAVAEYLVPPLISLTDEMNRIAQADTKWQKIIGYVGLITRMQSNPGSFIYDPLKGAKARAGIHAATEDEITRIAKKTDTSTIDRYLKAINAKTPKSGRAGVSSAAAKAEAEAKRIAALNERIIDMIARSGKDQLGLIDLEAEKYLKEGADRIKVEQWVAGEKDKINTDAMKSAWKTLEDDNAKRAAYIKEQMQQQEAANQAEISNKLAMVDIEEQYYQITTGEAATKRIDLLGQELKLHEGIRDAIVGFGPDAQNLRLQEQREIDGINARLLEQNKRLADRTALGGMTNALQKYTDEAMNMGAQIEASTTGALKSMEDGLVEFVTTGKLSFSSLVDSMIADIARITIRQSITGPLASALAGGIGSWFGTGAMSDADLGSGRLLGGYATGTNYVPETGAYLLHKGEAVVPADKNGGGVNINIPISFESGAASKQFAAGLRKEIEGTVEQYIRRHI